LIGIGLRSAADPCHSTERKRPATVLASLGDAAQAWKDIAGEPASRSWDVAKWAGTARRTSHGKICLGVSTKSGVAPANFISLAGHNLPVSWKTGFGLNVELTAE